MNDRATLPCRGEKCKDCLQTECLVRIMDDNEKTVMVLTEDLLRQVLKNQAILLEYQTKPMPHLVKGKAIAETEALLEKIERQASRSLSG